MHKTYSALQTLLELLVIFSFLNRNKGGLKQYLKGARCRVKIFRSYLTSGRLLYRLFTDIKIASPRSNLAER